MKLIIQRRVYMKFLIIIFLNLLFSQDINADPFSSGATTGSIGTVTINDEVYNQLSLRPEVPLGKLKVGLDVYFYFIRFAIWFRNIFEMEHIRTTMFMNLDSFHSISS